MLAIMGFVLLYLLVEHRMAVRPKALAYAIIAADKELWYCRTRRKRKPKRLVDLLVV